MLFKKLFINQTENIFLLMLRYAFVTGLSVLVDSALLFVFTEFLHVHYLISTIIASLLSGIVNYRMSISPHVFGKSKFSNSWISFLVFTLIGAGGLGINVILMWIFTEFVGLYYMLSKVISIVIVFLFNFFMRRGILFHKYETK